MDLRASLKHLAIDLGFDLVGIAPAVPGRDLEFVRGWLDRGYAGEMAYLSNPKRLDPALVLPSLQSVICVGLIYDTPLPYSTEVGSMHKAESSMQEAEGRRHETEGGKKESEARSQNPECRDHLPVGFQPSPSGRLCDGRTVAAVSSPPLLNFQPLRRSETAATTPKTELSHRLSGRGWPREAGTGEGSDSRLSSFDFRVSPESVPRAWISRYAWGSDYHEIMRGKLEQLRSAVEELAPGAETRVYVDTGPVSERTFARFSGLGWMGKNTCIINEEEGSWFFIGVIFTNLALEPDLPSPDRCGTCRACLDACPTGALVEPYVMDASKCISYLTIELKGSIPQGLRKGIGSNIFGCDICQDVCPWNGKSRSQKPEARSQETAFRPLIVNMKDLQSGNSKIENRKPKIDGDLIMASPDNLDGTAFAAPIQNPKSKIQNPPTSQHPEPSIHSLFNPPLAALAALPEDEFNQAFRHSPIRRTKYRGWLRNLCVAMGNSGDARFVTRLKELAAHPNPIVREHAEWALRQLSSRRS